MCEYGGYLNLPNEEWACKIMVNILINSGININMNENKKDDLIKALNIYQAYSNAIKEGVDSNEA